MKLRRISNLHGLIDEASRPDLAALVERIDEQLEELYGAALAISFGTPANGKRLENLDAVWTIFQFGASGTDFTIAHNLGRVPTGLLNVERPPNNVGTAPVVGQVTFGTLAPSATLVTVRTGAANKLATFILF